MFDFLFNDLVDIYRLFNNMFNGDFNFLFNDLFDRDGLFNDILNENGLFNDEFNVLVYYIFMWYFNFLCYDFLNINWSVDVLRYSLFNQYFSWDLNELFFRHSHVSRNDVFLIDGLFNDLILCKGINNQFHNTLSLWELFNVLFVNIDYFVIPNNILSYYIVWFVNYSFNCHFDVLWNFNWSFNDLFNRYFNDLFDGNFNDFLNWLFDGNFFNLLSLVSSFNWNINDNFLFYVNESFDFLRNFLNNLYDFLSFDDFDFLLSFLFNFSSFGCLSSSSLEFYFTNDSFLTFCDCLGFSYFLAFSN